LYFEGKLPDDYKYFLSFFDGGDLFNYNDVGGFTFFGSKRLIQENKFQRENHVEADLEEYWDNNVILFAIFICGDAEFLGFRPKENGEYDILDITLYEAPAEWRVIDNSFDNFVEKFIKEKGKAYWLYPSSL
ncbi:MAG: SMI1/KNR4 family protein, partial [Candidatus Azobacteroides sp.]|nr:SMI1/KNR4 family protein [Candidatus Azobacteroides sp.]